jgi:hypothetical protein
MLRPSRSLAAKPFCYAGTRNNRTSPARRARRKGAIDAGWRICAGRDGAYPRGETWRPFRQASYRHWIVQGTTSRSKTSAAETRVGQDEETSSARFTERENCAASQAVADTFTRGEKSAQTRTAPCRIASGAFPSGAFGRTTTNQSESFPRREKSRAHAEAKPLIRLLTSSH